MTTVAFQGLPGAYSHAAARAVFPDGAHQAFQSFEETLAAVETGTADYAVMPMENSIAGRVAEIQLLLLQTPLFIVGEHFQPIEHCLLGLRGAAKKDIQFVHSHSQALNQCRKNLHAMKMQTIVAPNTAVAAQAVSEQSNKTHGAISSALAAELYGLDILTDNVADRADNFTRFVVMAKKQQPHKPDESDLITSFVFCVRNIPAALFKAIGGFATNGVNLIKLESYIQDGSFIAADFYAEILGHPDSPRTRLAFDEMEFFTESHRMLGTYTAHSHRTN